MTNQLITRQDAHARGYKRYFTGKPCKYGHVTQRFVTTGGCVQCNALRSKLFKLTSDQPTSASFSYPLKDPADHAAAWAYCQALDLARGHMPAISMAHPQIVEVPTSISTTQRIQATRASVFGAAASQGDERREVDPTMAEQLRSFGLIK